MKPKKVKHNTRLPAGAASPTAAGAPAIPARRRRLYKLLLVGLPFLLVAALELALRLVGYGYPTSFFLAKEVRGKPMLVENPQFGWRFFPRRMARTPTPLLVEAAKPAGTIRIVVFGESAAMGDPEPAFGFSRMLEVLLQEAYPNCRFEVINTGMTAINSHTVRLVAHECARLQADYWVVYLGNNEVVGPFGSGTVFGPRAPSLGLIRAGLFLKTLKTGQLLEAAKAALFQRELDEAEWQGMQMFLRATVRAADPQMAAVYANFEQNLRDILAAGKGAGAQVLVCTVAASLRDCAPFASLHRAGWTAAEETVWQAAQKEGLALAAAGRPKAALEPFERLLRQDQEYAELHFRMAECYWDLGQFDQARAAYQRALELDVLRFRPDARINQIIAQTARGRAAEGIHLVEAGQQIAAASPHQVPGHELLWEHVHFTWDGNYLVARLLAEQLGRLLPGPARPWLASQAVAERLAYTEASAHRVAREVSHRLQAAPFTNQADHQRQVDRVNELLARGQPATAEAAWPSQKAAYQKALAERPADWMLAANYAQALQGAGEAEAALAQWQRVAELMPWLPTALFSQGNLHYEQGRQEAALDCFRQTLALKPDCVEAYNGMALSLLARNQIDEALAAARQALQCNRRDGDVHYNLGIIQARKGATNEAMRAYQQALAMAPDHRKARLNLGNLLSRAGRVPEAEAQFQELVKQAPDFAEGRSNYGALLARQGRYAEALGQFQEAVRCEPRNAEARFNLANGLAALQRFDEAIRQLELLLAQQPDWARARQRLEQLRQRKAALGP